MKLARLFLRHKGKSMFYVRFETYYGRCCMTAEIANFSACGEISEHHLIARFGVTGARRLSEKQFVTTSDTTYAKGETVEEAWKNAIEGIKDGVQDYSYNGIQVRYFWFVDYGGDEGWQNDELRQVVKAMPGVVRLGKYRNANTGNMLIGYMVPFENENGSDEYDD